MSMDLVMLFQETEIKSPTKNNLFTELYRLQLWATPLTDFVLGAGFKVCSV